MAHATLVFQVTSCESHYESVRRVKVGTGSPFDQGLALITSLCGTGWIALTKLQHRQRARPMNSDEYIYLNHALLQYSQAIACSRPRFCTVKIFKGYFFSFPLESFQFSRVRRSLSKRDRNSRNILSAKDAS